MGIFAEKKKKKEDDPLPTVVRYTTKSHQLQNAIKTHRQFEGWVKNQKKKNQNPPRQSKWLRPRGDVIGGGCVKKETASRKASSLIAGLLFLGVGLGPFLLVCLLLCIILCGQTES